MLGIRAGDDRAHVAVRRATLVLVLCWAGTASAGWSASAEIERFRWEEKTAPSVTETGPRFGLRANWTLERDSGWLMAYRGRLYFGSVDYDGALLFSGQPVSGTTDYFGSTHEFQGIYRLADRAAELIAGVGLDWWERELSAFQREDWVVAFIRLGAGFGARAAPGWFGGGGIKLPVYNSVDANLQSIGFDQNPALKPGKEPSLYAQVGYRFDRRWSLIGYYDSYRFAESSPVRVTAGPNQFLLFQPESSVDSFGITLQYSF